MILKVIKLMIQNHQFENDSVTNKEDNNSEASSEHSNTSDTDLKDSAKYTEDRHSSVVSDVKKEIKLKNKTW